jgi:nicotinamidase-related amidase
MPKKALVLIDIQNEYFPGGGLELVGPEAAAAAARTALEAARAAGILVVHVMHENLDPEAMRFRAGAARAEINATVAPLPGETVIKKHKVDSFEGTSLDGLLRRAGIEEIAVAGMMIHMCVDAFLRAADARDYRCSLLVDAAATRDLEWGGRSLSASDAKTAFYAAFAFFGVRMLETAEWAKSL